MLRILPFAFLAAAIGIFALVSRARQSRANEQALTVRYGEVLEFLEAKTRQFRREDEAASRKPLGSGNDDATGDQALRGLCSFMDTGGMIDFNRCYQDCLMPEMRASRLRVLSSRLTWLKSSRDLANLRARLEGQSSDATIPALQAAVEEARRSLAGADALAEAFDQESRAAENLLARIPGFSLAAESARSARQLRVARAGLAHVHLQTLVNRWDLARQPRGITASDHLASAQRHLLDQRIKLVESVYGNCVALGQ